MAASADEFMMKGKERKEVLRTWNLQIEKHTFQLFDYPLGEDGQLNDKEIKIWS